MPRLAGQIDLSKNEAILDAAVAVLVERGLSAPVEEIARRAGVSKQTVYNHYGSKAELLRALTARRVHEIVAPLEEDEAAEHPEAALIGYGRVMLSALLTPTASAFMRMAMVGSAKTPELGAAIFQAGPRASRRRLAMFLARETEAGRLACPDPAQAAEFFAGMVAGSYQTAALLGVNPELSPSTVEAIVTEAARRFLRAYAD
ncbi:MAG: TetR/AcrR family transcriptional regulator [Phenylobacterium sp.]|jgi:AcrR family transcriptional regulator